MASNRRSRSLSTPSEGEIIESGSELKATSSQSPLNGTSVDRPPRDRTAPRSEAVRRGSRSPRRQKSWSRSPSRSRSRSRSPYRANRDRGPKRRRDDDYDQYESRNSRYESSRRYGSRYDDRNDRSAPRRTGKSYHDYDRDESYGGGLRYTDDYDRRRDKRQRTHSRSPYREVRKPKQYDEPIPDVRPSESKKSGNPSGEIVSEGKIPAGSSDSKLVAETKSTQVQQDLRTRVHFADDTNSPSASEATEEPDFSEPVDEATALDARRKRREAIRAKYRSQATPLHLKALHIGEIDTDSSTPGTDASAREMSDSPRASPVQTPIESSTEGFPDLKIGKDTDLVNTTAPLGASANDEPSAADYDPTSDMKKEKQKYEGRQGGKDEVSSATYDETQTSKQDVLIPDAPPAQQAAAPAKDPYDMFADDDDDDMFAEDKDEKPTHASAMSAIPQAKELDISMMDNWDDPEGYYNLRIGELVDGRYHVTQNLGKGMFSSVVRATDSTTGDSVAIKIIRQNDTMRKAGMKEIEILELLREADPDDKKHLIKFIRQFEHKGHLCMVFENLSMNLREVLKKFGRDVGLNLTAIRAYAHQMFLGLSLLRKCNIIHADLKPDNLLVNEQRNILKVCDLGSASSADDNEVTPYLVSRFYRAPEIILGIPFDHAIDVWSIGCTLFELYTGKILFTGRNNNHMLKMIMQCRGKYPPKVLRRGTLAHHHFDHMFNFQSVEVDSRTGRSSVRSMDFKKPLAYHDLKSRLMGNGLRMSDAEAKEVSVFVDFLDRCLTLNPEKRITPAEALKHPFFVRKT